MEYYLLLPSDSEQDTLNEANLLGTESFGSFWPGSGLVVLMTLVKAGVHYINRSSITISSSIVLC